MSNERSPWFYVALGCVGVVLLVVLVVGIGGFAVFRKVKQFEAEMKDPVAREAKAMRLLGTEKLPEGYFASISINIPFILDMVILSDQPPKDDGEPVFGPHGFIYFKMIGTGGDEQAIEDYFSGATDDPRVLKEANINLDIDTDELIGRGVLDTDDGRLMYVAQRGEVHFEGGQGDGLLTLILVDCPGDERTRMAMWFGPDPDPSTHVDDVDFSGTTADEVEIEAFMEHFDLCP